MSESHWLLLSPRKGLLGSSVEMGGYTDDDNLKGRHVMVVDRSRNLKDLLWLAISYRKAGK